MAETRVALRKMDDTLLTLHLQSLVPQEIRILQQQGGITQWHVEEAQRRMRAFRETPGASESILFANKHTKTGIALLVECLAVLAFIPGGISAFGCHFEATTIQCASSDSAN